MFFREYQTPSPRIYPTRPAHPSAVESPLDERAHSAKIATTLLPALVTVLLGPPIAAPEAPPAPIVGGAAQPGDPAVVAVGVRRHACAEPLAAHCTGTLIAPRLVLTAAHCVEDPRFGGDLEVLFGSDVTAGDARVLAVVEAVNHPDYHAFGDAADLALLVLAGPADVAPIPLAGSLPDDLLGAEVRIVGFGTEGFATTTGTKRAGTSAVAAIDEHLIRTTPDPALSCHGDSGGPVLARFGAGEQLVAVAVSGDPGCASHGTNVRVDPFLADFIAPWIADTMGALTPAPIPDIAVEELCETPCTHNDECPSGLACLPGQAKDGAAISRCTVPGQSPGVFGEVCTDDLACAGSCLRMHSGQTPDACRCYEPCDPPAAQHAGCRLSSPTSAWPFGSALVILSALAGRRRRA